MVIHKRIGIWITLLLAGGGVWANNIQVSGTDRIGTCSGYELIRADISWDNSWRDSVNRDAAWIFVKYRETGTTLWRTATLVSPSSHPCYTLPPGAELSVPADGKGAFLYHASAFAGNTSFNGVTLVWDAAADGITSAATVDIEVMALEMVYVPDGSFYAGDGDTVNIAGQFEDGVSGDPFLVSSEAAITLGGGAPGSLGNHNRDGMANNALFSISPVSTDDFDDAVSQTLPTAFPKGFRGFYIMKYELTQEEFVLFLNALDSVQFDSLSASINANMQGTVSLTWEDNPNRFNLSDRNTWPNITTTSPNVPMIFLESYDAMAFADWAGLRPMSELEFEKAARGAAPAVPGEFAWGDASLNALNYFPVTNFDLPNEGIGGAYSTTAGNAWYTDTRAGTYACRAGIFAAHPSNTGRTTSGASFYGVMELSGNCWERTISVGRPAGRAFTGTHGDGLLTPEGRATNVDWPMRGPYEASASNEGCGYRGGGFDFPVPTGPNLRVSSRILATAFYNAALYDDQMRFVRTAE